MEKKITTIGSKKSFLETSDSISLINFKSNLFDDFEEKMKKESSEIDFNGNSEILNDLNLIKGKKNLMVTENNIMQNNKEVTVNKSVNEVKKMSTVEPLNETFGEKFELKESNHQKKKSNQFNEILKKKIQELEKNNTDLNENLIVAKKELDKYKNSVKDYADEKALNDRIINTKTEVINDLEKKVKTLIDELNEKKEEIKDLKSSLETAKLNNHTTEKTNILLKSHLEKERSNLEIAENTIEQLKEVAEENKSQIVIYEQKISYAENVFQTMRNDLIKKELKIKSINDELFNKNDLILGFEEKIKLLIEEKIRRDEQIMSLMLFSDEKKMDTDENIFRKIDKKNTFLTIKDNIEPETNQNFNICSENINCFVCDQACKSEWGLGVHINRQHPEYSDLKVSCENCKKEFKGYFGKAVHKKSCLKSKSKITFNI